MPAAGVRHEGDGNGRKGKGCGGMGMEKRARNDDHPDDQLAATLAGPGSSVYVYMYLCESLEM